MRPIAIALIAVGWESRAWAAASGDAARGQNLYAACTSSHSLVDNDIGPRHRGAVGRRAGTVAGFAYPRL